MLLDGYEIPCRQGLSYRVPASLIDKLDDQDEAYAVSWLALLADSPLGLKPRRVVSKFARQLSQDYSGTAIRLADLADSILRIWTWDNPPSLDYLKVRGTPIAKEILHVGRYPSPRVFQYVLSFLTFGKKAETKPDIAKGLETKALEKWLSIERRLKDLVLPDWLSNIKVIIRELLEPSFYHVPLPIHGRGRVSEKGIQSKEEKDGSIEHDLLISLSFSVGGYSPEQFVPERSSWWKHRDLRCNHVARLHFVPKTISSLRSICMEPATLQWAQQSVRYALENAIGSGPLNRFIRIGDQGYNRDASRYASETSQLDTIDLSSASDSVSWRLVTRIFPARILRLLACTRSTSCELPDGTIVPLSKFAPMGSACCFPIQSIIYCALVLYEYHKFLYGQEEVTPDSLRAVMGLINDDPYWFPSGLGAVRVYGDDIICDSRITESLICSLEELGFSINRSKSFLANSAFRESCGGYYLRGQDVTPYVLKLKDIKSHITPVLLDGLLDAANRAYDYSYFTLRDVLLHIAHMKPWHKRDPLPRQLFYDPYDGLKGVPVFTPRIRRRSHPNNGDKTKPWFQREEGRFAITTTDADQSPRDEVYGYVAWQRSPYGEGSIIKPFNLSNHKLKIVWVWKPI